VGRRAVVLGEVVVDLYPDDEVVAGSPLHVAAHLVSLGWTVFLITRIGRDARGEQAMSVIARQGIDPTFVETDPDLPTGTVTVHTDGELNRFDIHGPASWDAIAGPRTLPAHDAFFYGTLATRAPRTRSAQERLLAASHAPLRVLDANLRPPDVAADMVYSAVAAATTAKLSEEELTMACELFGCEPTAAALRARFDRLEWVCVTRGSRGAELHDRSGRRAALAPPAARVVNTIGAGDAFTAGLIDGLARGLTPHGVLDVGQRCATATLSRRGGLPDPPARMV
jgi:fructokinase